MLVHPSYGRGCGFENLKLKVDSVELAIITAKETGALIESMTALGFFSLGRETASIEASYESGVYTGTIKIGANDAPNFSLEFGDNIGNFVANDAPSTKTSNNRVVFSETLEAGKSFSFTASVN